MTIITKFITPVFVYMLFLSASHAATDHAHIEQRVLHSLRIEKVSDMIFPDAVSGDSPYTIFPGNGESPENASFKVYGEPGKIFRIILPPNGSIKLRLRGLFDQRSTVRVNKFESNFRSGYGRIDSDGLTDLFIGATRSALLFNQRSGLYRGRFQVTVVY